MTDSSQATVLSSQSSREVWCYKGGNFYYLSTYVSLKSILKNSFNFNLKHANRLYLGLSIRFITKK